MNSLRPLLNVAVVFILVAVSGWLVNLELRVDEDNQNRIPPTEKQARHRKKRQDPLGDIRYVEADREKNYALFGMDEDLVARTLTRAQQIEERYDSKLDGMLANASELVVLADALCGSPDSRPRYSAMSFLVEQKQTMRRPIVLRNVGELRPQDWAEASQISGVYAALELVDDRQDDSTLMGVAAIMVAREQDAIDHNKPWGRGLIGGAWSYKAVDRDNDGLEQYLIDYFALMHILVEKAQADGSICKD